MMSRACITNPPKANLLTLTKNLLASKPQLTKIPLRQVRGYKMWNRLQCPAIALPMADDLARYLIG
jgi:hypothetical protein